MSGDELVDTPIGRAFADRFGAGQAHALAAAALMHADDETHANHGSDPFRWVLAITIGYECWSVDGYRTHHGITAPVDEVREWIKTDGDLASHDGDVDYLALFGGAYTDFIPEASQ